MFSKRYQLYGIFLLVFIAQLTAIQLDLEALRLGTKPLVGFSLLLWLMFDDSNQLSMRCGLIIAIGFGMLGDIFLMMPDSELMFTAGLASFLVGHLLYVVIFLYQQKFSFKHLQLPEKGKLLKITSGLMAGIGLLVYLYLWSDLAEMKLPVAIYIVVIALMVITAAGRYQAVSQGSFIAVMLGAGLFAVSDTILAIDRFAHPFAQANFYIMLTYMAAQFLIVTQTLQRPLITQTDAQSAAN